MRTRSRLALVGLGATLLMALALNTAAARNLSISAQTFRSTFNNLEFAAEGVAPITCHVTLEGSLVARTIAKTEGVTDGDITRSDTAACNGGVTILRETLPWHITYVGFSGRLPNITLLIIRLTRPRYLIEPGLGFRCLVVTDVIFRFRRVTATGEVSGIEVPNQNVGTVSGGGFGCPVSVGTFRSAGDGRVATPGGAVITVTLI